MKKHKPVKDFNRIKQDKIYVIDYDYDTYYACRNGSNCCDGDYCRCGQIQNKRIEENATNAFAMANLSARNKSLRKDPRFYCLERWISCVLRENPDCFDLNIGPGYYGQEVYGVSMNWNQVNDINSFIDLINNMKPNKDELRLLVEKVLEREYGYILPAIKDKDWHYDLVSIKNIEPGNSEYKSMNSTIIVQYGATEAEHLSCLCKKDDNKYVLVDGYHRYAAAKKSDQDMLVMWCEV